MPAQAIGECPDCGEQLGVQVDDGIAAMAGGAIETMMDKDGNAIYCQTCDEWAEPDDITLDR